MPLGIKTESEGGGDFLPRIQYNAKAGRFFQVERIRTDDGGWQNDMQEMALPVRVAVDMEAVEVGWIRTDSVMVDFKLVPVGQDIGPQPTNKHRQGFRALVYNKGIGVRTFSQSAMCVTKQFDAVYTEWEAERGGHKGQVPVLEIARTTPVVSGTGENRQTNYVPEMKISEWITRPAALDEATKADDVPPPQEAAPQAAATNGATQPPAGQEF